MAWDSEVPKIGDTISIIPGSKPPAQRLRDEAEVVLAQVDQYTKLAVQCRDEADRHDAMAKRLQIAADDLIRAASRLEPTRPA